MASTLDQGDGQQESSPAADMKVLIHLKNPVVDDQKEFFGGHMRYPLIAYCLGQLSPFKEIMIFPQNRLTSKLDSDLMFMKEHLKLAITIEKSFFATTGDILEFAKAHIDFEGHPFFLLRLDVVMDLPFQAMIDLYCDLVAENIQFHAIMVAIRVDRPWLLDEVFKNNDENIVQLHGAKDPWDGEPEAIGKGRRKEKAIWKECETSKGHDEDDWDWEVSPLKVTCYIPGPHRSGWINTRLYLMLPSIFELPFSSEGEIESDLICDLVEKGTLYTLPRHGVFFDMPEGYKDGFHNFFSYMAHNEGLWVDETAEVDSTCCIGENVIIGPRCEVGPEVELENCILLDRVTVGEGALVEESVIGAHATLEPHSRVIDLSVIAKDTKVERNVSVDHALILASSVEAEKVIRDIILI